MTALPGLKEDWIELAPGEWVHTDFGGVLTLSDGISFYDYFDKRAAEPALDAAADDRLAEFAKDADCIDIRQRLKNATPAQIDTWLANNVTNIASARKVLGAIIKHLARKD